MNKDKFKIAYLSMEIALEDDIKTYAGGLGVLAGDILKSAADLKLPMVGITLLNDQGYFDQQINKSGRQEEYPAVDYNFSKLRKLSTTVSVKIGKDKVRIGAWEYILKSGDGFEVPVYLLDSNINSNHPKYKKLTGQLYGGGQEYRLLQEIILGRGGVKLIKALKYKNINKFHINEGHGSLAAVELFLGCTRKTDKEKLERVREMCVFTTHTPIKMAHDVFPLSMMLDYQKDFPTKLAGLTTAQGVNMTKLALYFSEYVNGVALSHRKVSSKMFPHHIIHAVTNGVHSITWTSPEFQKLYDKHLPNWRNSSFSLRNAFVIPTTEIWEAHQRDKKNLFAYIEKKQKIKLDKNIFTIGFARRFTSYKRPCLLFTDMDRLLKIHKKVGKIQFVFAGKAHPHDENGKKLIENIYTIKEKYKKDITIVFLEDYEVNLSKLMVAGVDIWLNTPLPPNEASGTSGMKAAHNGVLHLSTFDGWWREGYIRNRTGWTIRGDKEDKKIGDINVRDAKSLYDLLEKEILPRYYTAPEKWKEAMRFTIGVNASFFNTERVLQQYAQEAYI